MHTKIYNFLSDINNKYPADILKKSHSLGQPVQHTIIDNFLPQDLFDAVVNDIKHITNYTVFSNATSHRQESRNFVQAPLLQTLANSFHSSSVLHWLESISSIDKLIPDPHLRGGGLAKIFTNSTLALHTDFNWNDQLKLNRKVNLILYLTPNWQSEWNGDLELWNKENTECVTKIEPKANRLVFWNYEPWLVHGLSQPLNMPDQITRDNLIHFYYTSNATWEVDPQRSKFI
jgi:hypothetical protein